MAIVTLHDGCEMDEEVVRYHEHITCAVCYHTFVNRLDFIAHLKRENR